MTQRDMAGYFGIDTKTLYNWRHKKPKLYRALVLGLKVEEFLETTKKNVESLESFVNSAPELNMQKDS